MAWIIVLLFAGCAKSPLAQIEREYYRGDAKKAFDLSLEASEGERDGLVYKMMGGIIGFNLMEPKALDLLENAENQINAIEREGILSGVFDNLTAILAGETSLPYRGYLYEGVMVNYYKALLYMQKGEADQARIEFNRANDRQRRIKIYYDEEIQKAKQKSQNIQSFPNQSDEILSLYSNLEMFATLDGYINPMVSYVSGLFFMLEGDKKAQDLFKEAYGISRENTILKEDLIGKMSQKQTWVIIEDGRSPYKTSFGIFLPLVIDDALLSIRLELPQLQKGEDFGKGYALRGDEDEVIAQEVALLDPLVWGEFSQHLPFVIARSLLATTSKVIAQYYAQRLSEGVLRVLAILGGGLYMAQTARADLRGNLILPRRFWIAKIRNMKGSLKLQSGPKTLFVMQMGDKCGGESNRDGRKNVPEKLCIGKNNIIYVRHADKNIFYYPIYQK